MAIYGVTSSDHNALAPGWLFCFGLGYTGARLARTLRAMGWEVCGTLRDAGALRDPEAEGISGSSLEDAEIPPGTSHILSTIPPEEAGDPVLRHHANAIAAADGFVWLGYLSTTGVYGDRGGEWVDESDAPAPGNARRRRRLAAAAAWRATGAVGGG